MKSGVVIAALVLSSLLVACGKDDVEPASSGDPTTTTTEAAAPATEVDVTATDFAFDLPGGPTIEAGNVTINLRNDGAEEHQVSIVQLREGRSLEDLAAVGEDPSQLGDLVATFGGPNGVGPGDAGSATQTLEAGEYLFACFIPSPDDGVAHAVKGMITPVTVEGETDGGAVAGDADQRLVLDDYDFGLGEDALLSSGTFELTNEGDQYHEAVLHRPVEGATIEDVIAFFTGEAPRGPPPFTPAGGIAAIDPGQRSLTDIEPGEYVFVCSLPDATDGAPHFTKGMIQAVTVE